MVLYTIIFSGKDFRFIYSDYASLMFQVYLFKAIHIQNQRMRGECIHIKGFYITNNKRMNSDMYVRIFITNEQLNYYW